MAEIMSVIIIILVKTFGKLLIILPNQKKKNCYHLLKLKASLANSIHKHVVNRKFCTYALRNRKESP